MKLLFVLLLHAAPDAVWVEAEQFAELGGWVNDSQFIDQMGSPYLLANGNGRPVADAATRVAIPAAGPWRLWVRCKDWIPEHSPGRFQILLNGTPVDVPFGAAGQPGWLWQDGGTVTLPAGEVEIRLRDLTGWYGRCDAILFTRGPAPPAEPAALAAWRERLGGVSRQVIEHEPYELVVVGGGLAGCAAAIAAARRGLRVALLQDRPVLGGNASDEIGVGPSGDTSKEPLDPGETGIIEELEPPGRKLTRSEQYAQVVRGEANLELFLNTRATGVTMADETTIAACQALNVVTGERHNFRGRLFADCTGDGWLGYWSGAPYRTGREARAEFGEPAAPEVADQNQLSTSLYRSAIVTRPQPTTFVAPPWVPRWTTCDQFDQRPKATVHSDGDLPPAGWHDMTRGPGRHPDGPNGVDAWWVETGGTRDTIAEAEEIRDELITIKLGLWDHVKNHCPRFAAINERREFAWTTHIAGKRESRRLVGDYVMSQRDYMDRRVHPDTVLYAGYNVDPHHPNGFWTSGPQAFRLYHYKVSVPYRVLYSAKIGNLFMAGRNVSATHYGLQGMRVMRITCLMGQVVGTATALCVETGASPRGIYERHIGQLQQNLLRDGCYLMGVPNQDPADLARTATVTASSEAIIPDPRGGSSGGGPHGGTVHALEADRAVMFTAPANRLEAIELYLQSTREEDVELTATLCSAPKLGDFAGGKELARATATVPKATGGWVKFNFDLELQAGFLYYVWLPATEEVSWELYPTPVPGTSRAYRKPTWTAMSHCYKFRLTPGGEPVPEAGGQPVKLAAVNVIDGWNRAVAGEPKSWGPDPAQPWPQWLELKLARPVSLAEVQVTFQRHDLAAADYDLAVPAGDGWRTVLEVRDNRLRRQVHRLDPVTADRLRLILHKPVKETVQVCEVRVYAGP